MGVLPIAALKLSRDSVTSRAARFTRQQRVSLQMVDGRVVAGGQVLKEGIVARARRTRNQPPSGDGVKKSFLK